ARHSVRSGRISGFQSIPLTGLQVESPHLIDIAATGSPTKDDEIALRVHEAGGEEAARWPLGGRESAPRRRVQSESPEIIQRAVALPTIDDHLPHVLIQGCREQTADLRRVSGWSQVFPGVSLQIEGLCILETTGQVGKARKLNQPAPVPVEDRGGAIASLWARRRRYVLPPKRREVERPGV